MQDRLKFRYFNKLSNKMVEPKNWQNVDAIFECLKQQVCFDENISPLPYDHIGNGLVFMQCTGLKDKNGKLIYEGDIVKYKDEVYDLCIGRIKKDNAHYELQYYTGEKYGWFSHILFKQYIKNIEVIGNIYENPKLLENK